MRTYSAPSTPTFATYSPPSFAGAPVADLASTLGPISSALDSAAKNVLEFVKVDTAANLERQRIRSDSRNEELSIRSGGGGRGGAGIGAALGSIAPIGVLVVVGILALKLLKGR